VIRPWDFEYRALGRYSGPDRGNHFVIATRDAMDPEVLARALRRLDSGVRVEPVWVRAPLFWYRVQTESLRGASELEDTLHASSFSVRYVTRADQGSMSLGARLDVSLAPVATPRDWRVRGPSFVHDIPGSDRWFLGEQGGVDAKRAVCGTGAGARLAVIDDVAGDADALELDAEVCIGQASAPAGSSHGAMMVAWSVGSRGRSRDGIGPFRGVAPDASPRLYLIPKPAGDVLSLPLAIVRAVDDGADVVVCATYVETTTSPLLDDALEVAVRLGREGRGALVVFPTGREVSSPNGSVHASLTLELGDPASDPRVLCVAPSSRNGGWFLWTDKNGLTRPFANRGPAVRVAAPGDDMAYPFAKRPRLGHAESSGASAIAAGVALLVLATNPDLGVDELVSVLTRSARRPEPDASDAPFADVADVLPVVADTDGHDAKCGYGRVSALAACLAVADPVAKTLASLGEEVAAERFLELRASPGPVRSAYSPAWARWAARALRRDELAAQAGSALARHLRLVAGSEERLRAHAPGAMIRALVFILDRLADAGPPPAVRDEIDALRRRCLDAGNGLDQRTNFENAWFQTASEVWGSHTPAHEHTETRERNVSSVGGLDHSA
jgi:hypothetical protein